MIEKCRDCEEYAVANARRSLRKAGIDAIFEKDQYGCWTITTVSKCDAIGLLERCGFVVFCDGESSDRREKIYRAEIDCSLLHDMLPCDDFRDNRLCAWCRERERQRDGGVFCSDTCAREAEESFPEGYILLECQYCGREFESFSPYEDFCSQRCIELSEGDGEDYDCGDTL